MLSFSPRDVLDEILDLIESLSESFPTYFCVCAFLPFGVGGRVWGLIINS